MHTVLLPERHKARSTCPVEHFKLDKQKSLIHV